MKKEIEKEYLFRVSVTEEPTERGLVIKAKVAPFEADLVRKDKRIKRKLWTLSVKPEIIVAQSIIPGQEAYYLSKRIAYEMIDRIKQNLMYKIVDRLLAEGKFDQKDL